MKLYGSQAGWYFFVNNHLGTPQKIINESGQVVWAGFYLPFGKAWAYPATITNNFRFPGQYYDAETGLHYNWHRYYDPDTGRYITADPIGLEGGINLYVYVRGNPVNLSDLSGLYVWGINVGGSATGYGMKGGFSTAVLFDSDGNFAVITTQETGAGAGKAAGLFDNFVIGGEGTTVFDYAGTGISGSGSFWLLTGSVTVPVYGDDGRVKFFYEVGFSPFSKGTAEGGVTISFGQIRYSTDILGESGRWWGNLLYDIFHAGPCK